MKNISKRIPIYQNRYTTLVLDVIEIAAGGNRGEGQRQPGCIGAGSGRRLVFCTYLNIFEYVLVCMYLNISEHIWYVCI